MPSDLHHSDEYELELPKRESFESSDDYNLDDVDFETQGLTTNAYGERSQTSLIHSILQYLPRQFKRRRLPHPSGRRQRRGSHSRPILPSRRRVLRRSCHFCTTLVTFVVLLAAFVSLFAPSYTKLPPHYERLRSKVLASKDYGRANDQNEKIFIAASLYDPDGKLVNGAWGDAVLGLLDLLGNRNVFLSIYENDGNENSRRALQEFEDHVQSHRSLTYEKHLSLKGLPTVRLPDGSERTKRIAYLAETRNKALAPLDGKANQAYDKILFLNDVIFDPLDAAQLLFSTHVDAHGKARYNAACAVDFINPFKFYDTFATRDFEGYSMGVPFFPWFTKAGHGISRADVLRGVDAVRVKSCWGGMIAFDGKYFQQALLKKQKRATDNEKLHGARSSKLAPLRFRSSQDVGRESSECCLIHADFAALQTDYDSANDTGVYQNPFVRVAYGTHTFRWLRTTRRFERLFTLPHNFIDWIAGMPRLNPLRIQRGDQGDNIAQGGSHDTGEERGGFCSIKGLQVLRENPKPEEKNWESLDVP